MEEHTGKENCREGEEYGEIKNREGEENRAGENSIEEGTTAPATSKARGRKSERTKKRPRTVSPSPSRHLDRATQSGTSKKTRAVDASHSGSILEKALTGQMQENGEREEEDEQDEENGDYDEGGTTPFTGFGQSGWPVERVEQIPKPPVKRRKGVSPSKYFEVTEEFKDPKTNSFIKFGCARCGGKYKWKKSLNKHWREKHRGDTGDRSATPPGMTIILSDRVYLQTEPRKCVHKGFLKRITVKRPPSPEGDAPRGKVSASALLAAACQHQQKQGGELNGNPNSPARLSPETAPRGLFAAWINGPDVGDDRQTLLRSLNGSFVVYKDLNQSAQLVDETDGVPMDTTDPLGLGKQSENLPTLLSSGPSSSPSSVGLNSPMSSPDRHTIQQDLDELNRLEAESCLHDPDRSLLKCPKCGDVMPTQAKYSQHLTLHAISSKHVTKCASCRRHFLDMQALNAHYGEQHHSVLLACKESSQNQSNGHQQSAVHSAVAKPFPPNGLQCSQCPFLAKCPADLDKHSVSHSDKRPYDCIVCGSTYKRKADLSKHFQKSHTTLLNPYQRSTTPFKSSNEVKPSPSRDGQFEGEQGYEDTAKDNGNLLFVLGGNSLSQGSSSGNTPVRLSHWGQTSSAVNNLPTVLQEDKSENKLISKKNPPQGDQGRMSSPSLDTGDKSPQQGTGQMNSYNGDLNIGQHGVSLGSFQCPSCPFTSSRTGELVRHMEKHKPKRFGCPNCKYLSNWKYDVSKHIRRCAPGRKVVDHQGEASPASLRDSPNCVAGSRGRVSPVQRRHSPVASLQNGERKGFKCLFCFTLASSQEEFTQHVQKHLLRPKVRPSKPPTPNKYPCTKCPFTADSFTNYFDHYRSSHKKGSYSGKQDIDVARLKHPRKIIRTLKCLTCHLEFSRETHLVDHQNQIHGKNECHYCTIRWNLKEDYLDHLVNHTEFIPQEWEDFFMDVKDENNNKDSKQRGKGKSPPSTEKTSSSSSPPSSASPVSVYQLPCQWCGHRFRNIITALEHAKAVHGDQLRELIVQECATEEEPALEGSPERRTEAEELQVTAEDTRSDNPQTPSIIMPTPSWIHQKQIHTFKGIPLLLWKDDTELQFQCIFCIYTHHNPNKVISHVATVRHSLPNRYQCNFCQFDSNVIHEVMSHQQDAHPNQGPGITVLVWKEISVPQQDSDDDAYGIQLDAASHLHLSTPKSPSSTRPRRSSDASPNLTSQHTPTSSPMPPTADLKESGDLPLDLSSRPNVSGTASSLSSEKLSPSKEKIKSTIKLDFPVPRPRKRDLKAQEIVQAETKGDLGKVAESEKKAKVQKVLLRCHHCPFSCYERHELRTHCRFHGMKGRYPCDYCTFSHQDLNMVLVHRSLHKEEENYTSEYSAPSGLSDSSSD